MTVIARVRPRGRRCGDRARPAPARAPTWSPSTTRVDDARARARRRARRRAASCAPDADRLASLVAALRPRVAGAGRARDARRVRRRGRRRPAGAQRDRARLPVGAGAAGRPAADARRHRHRRQDDHDAAGRRRCSTAGGVRAVAAGNTDVPLVAALDLDVDAFVVECTQLPPGVDRALPWPTPRCGSTSRRTTSTGTPRWPRTRPPRRGLRPSSDPTTSPSGSPTIRSVMAHLGRAPGAPVARSALAGADYHLAGRRRCAGPHGPIATVASMRCAGSARTTSPTLSPRPRSCSRPGSSAPTRSPPALAVVRRSAAPHRAGRRRAAACAGSTTPRRRRRTPRRWRSGRSTTSC